MADDEEQEKYFNAISVLSSFSMIDAFQRNKLLLHIEVRTSSISSRSFVSMRIIFLPMDFSICSI